MHIILRALSAACLLAALPAAAFELGLPLDCAVPDECIIQNYVDTDPGPRACDHAGAALTYDGHKGTDFRLPDLHEMRTGVAVVAAEGGLVTRRRDGVPDGAAPRDGQECGNGIVIAHENGWETQYCHLRRGSIVVAQGERVNRGQVLGMVGMSGRADFPHVHLSIRDDKGRTIDPYTGLAVGEAACGHARGRSLWQSDIRPLVAHRAPLVQAAGFTGAAHDLTSVIDGSVPAVDPGGPAPALVFYGRAIGLSAGDVLTVELSGPPGFDPTRNRSEPMDRTKAQFMVFAGRKRPRGGFPVGDYTGRFVVMRDGAPILQTTRTIRLN